MNRHTNTTAYSLPFAEAVTVALSANAGVSITLAGMRIWIDALHRLPSGERDGYSHVSSAMWSKMQKDSAFTDPDVICFTHCHRDHYSEEMALQAVGVFKKAGLILPEPLSIVNRFPRTMVLTGHHVTLSLGDVTLRFIRLPHEGPQYRNVIMYGVVISSPDRNILVASDCETASPRLADVLRSELKGMPIDLAILPFPWMTLRKGRSFLEQNIHPDHLILYHIPFEEDDVNGYREAAEASVSSFLQMHGDDHMDVRLLDYPLQTELIMM